MPGQCPPTLDGLQEHTPISFLSLPQQVTARLVAQNDGHVLLTGPQVRRLSRLAIPSCGHGWFCRGCGESPTPTSSGPWSPRSPGLAAVPLLEAGVCLPTQPPSFGLRLPASPPALLGALVSILGPLDNPGQSPSPFQGQLISSLHLPSPCASICKVQGQRHLWGPLFCLPQTHANILSLKTETISFLPPAAETSLFSSFQGGTPRPVRTPPLPQPVSALKGSSPRTVLVKDTRSADTSCPWCCNPLPAPFWLPLLSQPISSCSLGSPEAPPLSPPRCHHLPMLEAPAPPPRLLPRTCGTSNGFLSCWGIGGCVNVPGWP